MYKPRRGSAKTDLFPLYCLVQIALGRTDSENWVKEYKPPRIEFKEIEINKQEEEQINDNNGM